MSEQDVNVYVKDLIKLVDHPTEVKMIGNTSTICQIILLLAYIRNAIKNNKQIEIKVNVGKNVENGKFLFDVNNIEIPDLKALTLIDID